MPRQPWYLSAPPCHRLVLYTLLACQTPPLSRLFPSSPRLGTLLCYLVQCLFLCALVCYIYLTAHARFSNDVILNTELNRDPTNWVWSQCLAFPINKLNNLRFSSKSYKWIRYVTGVIVGAHGELYAERDLPRPIPVDYDTGLSAESIDLYYHTTDQEKCHLSPAGPNLASTRTASG